MILSELPEIETELESIRKFAAAGFVLALNVRWIGPEHLHSEFPPKWRKLYEEQNYFMFDPVYYWTVMNTGTTRWSEIAYPDVRHVAKKAAEHGLVYGATVCVKTASGRSFLSAARADRELNAKELNEMENFMANCISVVNERPILTDVELETLRCLRNGMDHKQIAETLKIAQSTVKKRLQKIRRKFNANTVTQALSIATEKRYFDKF